MTAPSPKVSEQKQAGKKSFKDWQYDFTAHIRDPEIVPAPEGIEPHRIKIYSDLFYNNIEGFISNGFPVLRSLYNDEDWHKLVRHFFKHHRNKTPYFLEVSQEFLDYLQNERGEREEDYPFMLELAHYEWVELALMTSELDEDINWNTIDKNGDLLNNKPVLSPLAWSFSYQYPVQQISEDFLPGKPAEQPVHLLVYRDNNDEVHFMELNPVTAILIQTIIEDNDLSTKQILEMIAEQMQHPAPNVVIQGGLQVINDLKLRNVILGTHKP